MFFLDRHGWTAVHQPHHVSRLSLNLQQLLRMALLHVSGEVVLPPEALGAVLTEEVLPARVDNHVSPDILARVEPPVTVVALVFLLLHPTRRFARVGLQVFEQDLGGLERLQTHLAGQVAISSGVESQVALVAQLGVIVLAALFTLEGFFVRVMGLKVVLQVIFTVKHLFTVGALVYFLR